MRLFRNKSETEPVDMRGTSDLMNRRNSGLTPLGRWGIAFVVAMAGDATLRYAIGVKGFVLAAAPIIILVVVATLLQSWEASPPERR